KSHRIGAAINRRDEGDRAGSTERRPSGERRKRAAAGRGIANIRDDARQLVLDDSDGTRRYVLPDDRIEGDRSRVVEVEPFGEPRKYATRGRRGAGAQQQTQLLSGADEDPPQDRALLDQRGKGHFTSVVDDGIAEARERATARHCIARACRVLQLSAA